MTWDGMQCGVRGACGEVSEPWGQRPREARGRAGRGRPCGRLGVTIRDLDFILNEKRSY